LSNYEAGRRLEYRIRNLFQKQGFVVIRAAQSKPIDLVCIKDGKPFLIECKAGRSYMGKERREEILALSRQAGAPVILAKRRKRRVELLNLADGQALNPENLGGVLTA